MKPFSMTLNVAFDDPASMQQFLAGLASAFEAAKAAVSEFVKPVTDVVAQVAEAVTAPAPAIPAEKGKRGPKPKVAPVEVATAETPDEISETAEAPKVVPEIAKSTPTAVPGELTLDKLRARAMAFSQSKGGAAFVALLAKFHAARISEIQVADYRAVWEALAV